MTTRLRAMLWALLLAGLVLAACGQTESVALEPPAGADPAAGRVALREYGCGACHEIPGVAGAHGVVGPPLDDFARRKYIAGNLPNDAENLVRWIINPQGIEPGTAMPTLGVSQQDALDITAYLATLR